MFKTNSQKLSKNDFNIEETIYKYLYKIPPKEGRYIVLDTETTGLNEEAQIVELGAHEIINGKLTGNQFHIYIRPRIQMNKGVIQIHKITNSFYDDFFSDVYENDKQNLFNFCKFLGNSIIFAHNAPFDMNVLNNELRYWDMNEIPIKRYRCSMRIFMEVIGQINIKYSNIFTSLANCCEYFNLKSPDSNFHNGLFDSFMTARMICKIYETLDNNPSLKKKLGCDQKALDYFIIDNIFKKSKRLKNDIPKRDVIKKNSKTIINNMNCSKEKNYLNNKCKIKNSSKNIQTKNNDQRQNYNKLNKKFKNENINSDLILNPQNIKEINKIKCNSVEKHSIYYFENIINNNKNIKKNKEFKSDLISTIDKNIEEITNDKSDCFFENEDLTEEVIDELFSELL